MLRFGREAVSEGNIAESDISSSWFMIRSGYDRDVVVEVDVYQQLSSPPRYPFSRSPIGFTYTVQISAWMLGWLSLHSPLFRDRRGEAPGFDLICRLASLMHQT
jgi:hypothetical protein